MISAQLAEDHNCEWLDLKSLTQYACVSERTPRGWIHRVVDPLPATRVGTKILVRRAAFDSWLEAHKLRPVDVGCIVDELVVGLGKKDRWV